MGFTIPEYRRRAWSEEQRAKSEKYTLLILNIKYLGGEIK
jgi:hypothetical protein